MTSPFRVLVAEDSPTVRDILSFLLDANGYEVVTAEDGVAAVQAVLTDAPDLLLLDVDMPKMNGYQVCRLLKADPSLSSIPVVMLTSRDRRLDRMWGLSTGADAYLVKALDEDEPFGDLGKVLGDCLAGRTPRPRSDGAAPAVREDEILGRLNGLLDRSLFQMTLRRRVSDLAQALQDLDETVRSIVEVLEQAADVAGLALVVRRQGEGARCWLHGRSSLAPAELDRLSAAALSRLAEAKVPVTPAELATTVLAPGGGSQTLGRLEPLYLTARGATIGVAVLGFMRPDEIEPGIRGALELLLGTAATVLDNARLYAGLQETNDRLQRTLDELTSTQTRLAQTERRVEELEIIIDQSHKEKKVSEILESDYFQGLKERVRAMRTGGETKE